MTICSLCILNISNFGYFPFCFEGGIRVLIVPVPVHCILVTFVIRGIYLERPITFHITI